MKSELAGKVGTGWDKSEQKELRLSLKYKVQSNALPDVILITT